jgi:PD-(D/E)XK nuclease superfamily protein
VTGAPSQAELERLHCWETEDRVSGRPQMTDFRRTLRYHQTRWRESKGHPIGTQPIVPRKGKPSRPVGSRMPLDYARETGATFVTAGALDAATARTSFVEPHQSFDHQRLWADLLWPSALSFNLFGDLAGDLALADRAVHTWWPDAPGKVCEVRFEHSPGRFDWAYLGSLRAFDAVFYLDVGDGTQGIVAVDVKYHEWAKPATAKPIGRPRQHEVAKRSRGFKRGAVDAVDRTGLLVTALEHLLMLSMLQHESGRWSWGRYVAVYPAGNSDFAHAYSRYADLLTDGSTFASVTIEELLDAGALPRKSAGAFRERYLVGHRGR